MASVSIRNVHKSYGRTAVIHGLDLEIAHEEFVVMVGPSGCGKSTMLRMIAGLEEITAGEVWIGDRLVNNTEPKDRNVAMVFQNYALYPHMSVFRNIAFGLRAARLPKPEIAARVQEAARILGLEELLERKPAQLSGGQRQRVAMGRAIVREPQVFLFDEPLSNLDAKLRHQMRAEIKKLHQTVRTTAIYVTHDQIEAMTLADRIVVMRDGVIQQVGTPLEVFTTPANMFVAGFIGSPAMNMLPARFERQGGRPTVRVGDAHAFALPREPDAALGDGAPVVLGIRPDDLLLCDGEAPFAESWRLEAPVHVVEPMGTESLLLLELAERELVGKAIGRSVPATGPARLAVNLAHVHLFDPDSERTLY